MVPSKWDQEKGQGGLSFWRGVGQSTLFAQTWGEMLDLSAVILHITGGILEDFHINSKIYQDEILTKSMIGS
jgi:hypothetical protein